MRTLPWMLIALLGLAISTSPGYCAESNKPMEPKWLAGKPVNAWLPIPNTSGAGGAAACAFSGMTLKPSTSEVIIAAAGGHGDSSDNRVVSIKLSADAPQWVQRCAPSTQLTENVAYYADGKPNSRHTYHATQYVPSLDRVMLVGCRFTWPGAHEHPKLDGFDLNTNKWDPAGTWPDVPKGQGYGVVQNPATGDLYTQTLAMWSPATKAWSHPITKRAPAGVRFPYAFDTRRNQIFGLNAGDGQGYGDMNVLTAVRAPVPGKESMQVTFKPGDALEQFKKDKPVYCGMDYDPDNDRFLFYNGVEKADAGRIYIIKPNESNAWEISILACDPSSTPPPPAGGAGVNNRFRYVPQLKGFVLLATRDADLYFIRTAGDKKK